MESKDAPAARDSGLTSLGKTTIAYWFHVRHRGEWERSFARSTVKDGQFWLRLTGRKARRGT